MQRRLRQQWPPVLIAAGKKPVAGPGTTAGSSAPLKRPDGTTQVTYAGLALSEFSFAGDTNGGQINGQGLEKQWYAMAALREARQAAACQRVDRGMGGTASNSSTRASSSSSSGVVLTPAAAAVTGTRC